MPQPMRVSRAVPTAAQVSNLTGHESAESTILNHTIHFLARLWHRGEQEREDWSPFSLKES